VKNEEKHTHFKRVVVAKCFAPDSNVEFPVVFKADEPLKTETNVNGLLHRELLGKLRKQLALQYSN